MVGLKNHVFDHETWKSGLFPCYRLKINDFLISHNQNLKINIFTPQCKFPATAKVGLAHYNSFCDGGSHILKEKSNLPGSIFPGCTTAGLVIFASAAVCMVFTCIQQFNANCLFCSIQTDFIPLHFSLWIVFTRKNKSV